MNHLHFNNLRKAFAQNVQKTELDSIEIHQFGFNSKSSEILPGKLNYECQFHGRRFEDPNQLINDVGTIEGAVHIKDISVQENNSFKYQMLVPRGHSKVQKVILLFHGFNEKNWDKYLTWAQTICEKTKSAVVLFPIAFHMQRAPQNWSGKRKMFSLSEERKKKFPNIIHSTLSNVAISMRLHTMPQRFIWSGLQTYYDVIQFIENCQKGQHPLIDKQFNLHIFAYSIGGLLAQILKLSNHNHYFDNSKICLFCSGAVFNRLSPVSKFILDSEANVALYSFLVEHFDSYLQKNPMLRHFIDENHFEGKVFHSMLEFQKMREFREELLKKAENDIYAITLKKDRVIPPFEIINTLQGAFRDINIPVDILDFDYDYIHENPFPVRDAISDKVDEHFHTVFDKVCNFLNG
jgi:hypothetical protein